VDEEELTYTATEHLKQYLPDRLGWSLCDLRKVDDIREKVKKAAEFFDGRIDVLINNGGEHSLKVPHYRSNRTD